jgi:hypothetical protein
MSGLKRLGEAVRLTKRRLVTLDRQVLGLETAAIEETLFFLYLQIFSKSGIIGLL